MALTAEQQAKMAGASAAIRSQVAPAPAAAPPPAAPPATPAPAPEPAGQPRGQDGKFAPKGTDAPPAPTTEGGKTEPVPPIREALRRQTEKNRALEAERKALNERLAALEAQVKSTQKPPEDTRRSQLLSAMDANTQKWFTEGGGRDLIRLEAEEIARAALAPHEAAIKRANDAMKNEQKTIVYAQNFADWVDEQAAEGNIVDEGAMVQKIREVDGKGWRLGTSDADHFRAIFEMLKAEGAKVATPVVTGDAAKEAARKEAEAKARAGGVAPGSAVTPPPSNEREEFSKALREASWKGDVNARQTLLRQRLRGQGIFPGERPGEE